jgi:2-phosphoglycerate kinase
VAYTDVEFDSPEALVDAYRKDCEVVREGVSSDINKCLKDGKSLIIEGFHIDPRLYQAQLAAAASRSESLGIVVPFLLTLNEADHLSFITHSPDPRYRTERAADTGFRNLQRVQQYLRTHAENEGMVPFTEIPINLHSFHETLDLLHDVVLKRIEEVYIDSASLRG